MIQKNYATGCMCREEDREGKKGRERRGGREAVMGGERPKQKGNVVKC